MRKNLLAPAAWIVVCAANTLLLPGQTITGSIVGSIVDSSGLPTPAAEISVVYTATGATRTARSDERGDFVLGSLQPGEYQLSIVAKGFKTLQRQKLVLSANETLPLGKIQLEVGAVTETITVSGQAATVQIASGEHADLLAGDQIEGLMTKSRNVMSLLSLMPGVYDAGSLGDQEAMDRNFELYVQGGRRNSSSVSLDGMATNSMGNNFNNSVTVSQDSIAEVKALLSNYAAEYGRSAGATVNVITKGGTKNFHGLGSYFKRHEQFNANSFFNNRNGLGKPRYRYNTWSYNIGGPVYIPGKFNRNRDKLFFFWSQEFWPRKGATPFTQLTVPTELERRGDFTQSVDLNNRLVTVNDPTTRAPFPDRIIPASRLDPSGAALLKVFPLPNRTDRSITSGNYNYVFQADKETPIRLENLRADYIINTHHSLAFTFASYQDTQTGGLGILTAAANWPQMVKTYRLHGQGYVLRYTGVWRPTVINEMSLGFTRRPESATATDAEIARNQRATVGYTAAQFNPSSNPLGLIPNATFGGVTNAANLNIEGRFPFWQRLNAFNLTDNTTKIWGPHTFKVGILIERNYQGANQSSSYTGTISFSNDVNNPLNVGYAYANAAAGVFQTYTEASNRAYLHYRQHQFDWFVQDSWRATRRLSLEIGVRFQHFIPIFMSTDALSSFSPALYNPAKQPKLIAPAMVNGVRVGIHPVTGAQYNAALIGAIAPGTGDAANGVGVAGKNGYPRSLIDTYSPRLGPRFGFAYDVFGTGKTALRGGFGMFNSRPNVTDNYNLFVTQLPIISVPTVYYSTLGSLLSSAGALFPQSLNGLDRSDRLPHVMNYSFSWQQYAGRGIIVEAGYVGSLSRNLMWRRNLNSIPTGTNFLPSSLDPTTNRPLATAFLRPIIGYTDIFMSEPASSSNYNSGHITARRRLIRNVQFGLSWTWSKAMDFNDNDTDGISSLVSPRVWNYSMAAFDRTHMLKLNWMWMLPKLPVSNAALKQAFNGWQLSGITSFISGAPTSVSYSSTNGIDVTGTATQSARIVVLDNPVLPKSERTFSRNFRTDVFAVPDQGTWGNAARYILRGPGVNNWDLSLLKDFPVHDQMRFQFRAEAYNAFNHAQFSAMDTGARFDNSGKQINAALSQFTAARSPRTMQFALRFYF
jgi:hypothetical protein